MLRPQHKHLLGGASNPKTTTQYNKCCIWILKLRIQIKFSMAWLETYRSWIISESWYCVKRPISLHHTVLFHANFHSCSVQAHLNAFVYLTRVVWITSARFSLRFSLVCTLKGMAPPPHVIMPRSRRIWLKASFTNVGLSTLDVYYKWT
jgi:hypothetical protein